MPAILSFCMAFALGIGLGFLHFGALWQTLQRLATARQPHLLLLASSVIRLSISAAGLYGVIVWGDWLHLLVCLVGFLSIRQFLIRRWRPAST